MTLHESLDKAESDLTHRVNQGGTIANFEQLEEALREWMHEAVAFLVQGPEPTAGYDLRHWRRDEDGVFRRRDRSEVQWPHESVDKLTELASWNRVEAVVSDNSYLRSQVNTLVGTAHSLTRFELGALGRLVLPKPNELDDTDAAFTRRYETLEWFISTRELDYIAVWPVPGMLGVASPIQLEPDLQIDVMTDGEVEAALNSGVLRPIFAMNNIFLISEDRNPACLRHRYRLPKVVGEEHSDVVATSEVQNLEARLGSIREVFEQILALLFQKPPALHGRVGMPARSVLGGFNFHSQEATLSRAQRFQRVELDEQAIGDVQSTWQYLTESDVLSRRKDLAVTLRRLRDQARREHIEDELVDVMIGAEALYLSDLGNEELSFRLALRASAWAVPEDLHMSRRDVFNLMRSAYRVRSAIVHGNAPRAKDLKVANDEVSLNEFVRAVEQIIRHGLKTAFAYERTNKRWPPDWDELTLPPRDPST